VRELKNVIERMVILTPSEVIGPDQVRRTIGPGSDSQTAADPFEGFTSLREGRESFERQFILKKLDEAGGNVVRAAELLGLERSNLYRKMRAYGIRGGEAQ
jgi:two-component system nitrogen regulation response regulator NtrX